VTWKHRRTARRLRRRHGLGSAVRVLGPIGSMPAVHHPPRSDIVQPIRTTVTLAAVGLAVVALVLFAALLLQVAGASIGIVERVAVRLLLTATTAAFVIGLLLWILSAPATTGRDWRWRFRAATALASASVAIVAFLPAATAPSSLGALQLPLIGAGILGVAASPWLGEILRLLAANHAGATVAARARIRRRVRIRSGANRPRGPARSPSDHAMIILVLFLTFLVRYLLSSRNSYWLDELYSVERYLLAHNSLSDAISDLSETSIHPPLYQYALYYWVQWFGSEETATRTLSNLYVSVGVLATYATTFRRFGRTVATTSALVLTLSYPAMYFGLETRSYAQSLMLAALSSWAALSYLGRSADKNGASPPHRRSKALIATLTLCVVNIAFILTHYYNLFFWAAQAAFVISYLIATSKRGTLKRVAAAVAVYASQLAVFFLIWGSTLVDSYQRNEGRFEAQGITITPLEMLRRVSNQTFNLWPLGATIAVLGLGAGVLWLSRRWRKQQVEASDHSGGLTALYYLACVTVGAPTVAYLAFTYASAERFFTRYMIFLVPGVVVLAVLVITQLAKQVLFLLAGSRGSSESSLTPSVTALLAVGLSCFLVAPGTIRAATIAKDDWRGTATAIVDIVRSNPDSSYVIYEPSWRITPMLDHYLRRYSDDIRVSGTIRRSEERSGGTFGFERQAAEIEVHDFLIVPFIHHTTDNFPTALERLDARYERQRWQINPQGKGLVVFRLPDNG
jgi:hypothetical protein